MRPTGSAPHGAAATIAALPEYGRTAVVVVLGIVIIVSLGAALAALGSLFAGPRRRHHAARSTFYLAAMPTPLATAGRHRDRRRSAVVRWTAWPNPWSGRRVGEPSVERDAHPGKAPVLVNPAARNVTPVRVRRRGRRDVDARLGVPKPRPVEEPAFAAVPVCAEAPHEERPAAEPAVRTPRASAGASASGAGGRRSCDPRTSQLQRRAREELEAAAGAADALRRLGELSLEAVGAETVAVVLSLPDGLRIASVADARWGVFEGADGVRRRGCPPDRVVGAVSGWRRLVDALPAGVPTRSRVRRMPWAGGPPVREIAQDADGRPRALVSAPLHVGPRAVGAVIAVRPSDAPFSSGEQTCLVRITRVAGARLGAFGRAEDSGLGVPGDRDGLLRDLRALLPDAALPGWAPVLVSIRIDGPAAPSYAPVEEPDVAAEAARTLEEALAQVLREEDRLYRWSPREVLLLLPDLPRARTAAVLRRVQACVATVARDTTKAHPQVRFTVGHAAADCTSPVKLVRAARRAVDCSYGGSTAATGAGIASGGDDARPGPAIPAPRIMSGRRPRSKASARSGD